MTATATRPSNPQLIPMTMAQPVDRPEGGAELEGEDEGVEEGVEGGAVVVAGQVVEFSWEGRKSKT